jgi:hypothetical protein
MFRRLPIRQLAKNQWCLTKVIVRPLSNVSHQLPKIKVKNTVLRWTGDTKFTAKHVVLGVYGTGAALVLSAGSWDCPIFGLWLCLPAALIWPVFVFDECRYRIKYSVDRHRPEV